MKKYTIDKVLDLVDINLDETDFDDNLEVDNDISEFDHTAAEHIETQEGSEIGELFCFLIFYLILPYLS